MNRKYCIGALDEEMLVAFFVGIPMLILFLWVCLNGIIVGYKRQELYAVEIAPEQICEVYSMDLQNEVSGYGNKYSIKISTDSYYYFYVKSSYGYSIGKVLATETQLIESSEVSPSLWKYKAAGAKSIQQVLYVPVGTVVEAGFDPF